MDPRYPIRRVYICNQVREDLLQAARRLSPDVVPVTRISSFPDNVDRVMSDVVRQAESVLAGFNMLEDVLALIGDPIVMAACIYVLTRRSFAEGGLDVYPDGLSIEAIIHSIDAPCWRVAKYDNLAKEFYIVNFPLGDGGERGKDGDKGIGVGVSDDVA